MAIWLLCADKIQKWAFAPQICINNDFADAECGLRLDSPKIEDGYIDTTKDKGLRLTCEPTEPLNDDQQLQWLTSNGEQIGSSSPR